MDAALQTATPSHAHRLVALINDSTLRVFPDEGFGGQAYQLERCLVYLPNVHVDGARFNEWHRNSVFYRHIRRIYWLDGSRPALTFDALLSMVVEASHDVASLKIKSFPKKLEHEIAMHLPLEIKLDPRQSSHVLSVIQSGNDYLFGISKREHNYFQLSMEPKAFEEYSSSAVNKLNETIRHLKLSEDEIDSAIDLGASPGGWTRYLAQYTKTVYSIDAADLSAEVTTLKNVVHIKCVAEKAIDELKRLLPSGKNGCSRKYVDLIVSDMNVTPFTLLPYLESYASFLKPDGRLIATLKFIGTGNNREIHLKHLRNTLEEGPWMSVRFLWCMANTKSTWLLHAFFLYNLQSFPE